jgi:hypothetical protein
MPLGQFVIDPAPYVGNIQTGFPADIYELYRRCLIRSRGRLEDHTLSPPPQRSCQRIHERTGENKEGRTKEMPPLKIHTCDFPTSEWMLLCTDSASNLRDCECPLWGSYFPLTILGNFRETIPFPSWTAMI